jgi:hypothetical protein
MSRRLIKIDRLEHGNHQHHRRRLDLRHHRHHQQQALLQQLNWPKEQVNLMM